MAIAYLCIRGYTIGRRSFSSEKWGMYMAWGGSRRGAGRPRNPIKRIGRTFRLSDEEFLSLKPIN